MKRILYHISDKDKARLLQEKMRSIGVQSKPLSASEKDAPVGKLFGMSVRIDLEWSRPKAPADFVLPEIIIFFGIDEKELDQVLSKINGAGLGPEVLKAIVTMYNMSWSVYMLTVELQRERDELGLGR